MALASWLLLLKTTGIHAASLQKKNKNPPNVIQISEAH